ncbi:MAG TPA: DUF1800 domain-containing protein [Gemmatimonadaceae bacterium]|nr:DUF1800 domain-containing protein [Gemmatimonadaceae bacterium]
MARPLPIAALLATLAAAALPAQPRLATPAPPTVAAAGREQTRDQQVRHVLDRLAFGPRPGDIERVRAMGVDAWIARQLTPERIPDPTGDALMAGFPSLALSLDDRFRHTPPPPRLRETRRRGGAALTAADSAERRRDRQQARRAGRQLLGELASMRVARAVATERQLEEVMVDVWENHFNVFAGKGPYAGQYLVGFDRDVIRPHALGRFRDLLGAVARSPAMLVYLDNAQSQATPDAPTLAPRPRRAARQRRGLNENYARELLELHTLGVDGGYTQHDVIEVARALTGWTIAPPAQGGGFVFRPALHDAGAKTVLGASLPAGRGIEDGEQVLDLLARHPATARFIATKLARRFVSDTPPPALVARAAETFRRTDGDIREVVRTIVTSPEFFSAATYRSKVKSPLELVVSALRALCAEPDTTPRTAQVVARLGQPLFGHQAPDGYPETGEAWINGGAILKRIDFGLAVAAGALPGVSVRRWAPARELAGAPREQQVDGILHALLGGAASPDTRQVLLRGENPLLARADGPTRRAPATDPLAALVGLALGSPEFQRR